jgi:hypothetical protein
MGFRLNKDQRRRIAIRSINQAVLPVQLRDLSRSVLIRLDVIRWNVGRDAGMI